MSGLLLVHAHPDDETITTGATMARYAAEGVPVALVTCTRGEEGEVIPAGLSYLEDDRDGALGPYRVGELRRALAALDVENHWYLDDLASASVRTRLHYRDSGMAGTPPAGHPDAFASADVEVAATALAELVDRLAPEAVVTYDPEGGYGHPDHVQAHRVLTRAVEISAFAVPRVYWVAVPRSAAGDAPGLTSMVMDDELVTTAVDGAAYLDRKVAALRAHATQVEVAEPDFALSNGIWQPIAATEYYRQVQGEPVGPSGCGRSRHRAGPTPRPTERVNVRVLFGPAPRAPRATDRTGGWGMPTEKGLVLVVEDEEPIVSVLRLYLTREGFTVHAVSDGETALADVRRLRPTAVILDIGLPGLDGFEVCRRLREGGDWTPVLVVTARDDETDRVLGLELGADDYVTKPFSPRELVARLRAVLRRGPGQPAGQDLRAGRVRLDVGARRVWADEQQIDLTATEFDLLAHLLRRPGRVFGRDELLAQVWGYNGAASRTVDVHVAQLRAKLGDSSPIRTVRGVGYAVEDPS